MNSTLLLALVLMLCLVLLATAPAGAEEPPTAAEHPPVFRTSDDNRSGAKLSRMWDVYGRIVDGAVQRFGNEPAYYEWLALKLMWSDLERDKATLRQKIRDWPMNAEGYLWSWSSEEGWPTHHGRHYENNAKYILAVCRIFFWSGDESFLHEVDRTTAESKFPEQVDVSEGMTVLEKTRKAMEYQLETLNGREGILRIDDPKADGTVTGLPGDYWDNYRFGYLSGYTNVYFHGSLRAMAELEGRLGNREKRREYIELAEQVRRNFNEIFWDEEKGRYIGCIDVDGNRWDFGFTYMNTEAIFYGLAPQERAKRIYQWLDGERIIESDLQEVDGRMTGSVGEDIYALGWAPRANTRAVESVTVDGRYWWWDIGGAITVGGVENPSARYGEHLENGGGIFYTSFYDVMSRLRILGPDEAWERLNGILEEFAVDELRRRPPNSVGATWMWGIIGEFPESGLVPTTFLYGFMGIDAVPDALRIRPRLPEALRWGQVDHLAYRGRTYSIRAGRDEDGRLERLEVSSDQPGTVDLRIGNLQRQARYDLSLDGQVRQEQADAAGRIVLRGVTAQRIELSPAE